MWFARIHSQKCSFERSTLFPLPPQPTYIVPAGQLPVPPCGELSNALHFPLHFCDISFPSFFEFLPGTGYIGKVFPHFILSTSVNAVIINCGGGGGGGGGGAGGGGGGGGGGT